MCCSTLKHRLMAVQDAEKYLFLCRSSYQTKRHNFSQLQFPMQSRRQIDCFGEIVGQIERFGLAILHPALPLSFDDEDMFLAIVFMIYMNCDNSEIAAHLKCVISRDELYIKVLSSHLHDFRTIRGICEISHVFMAQYVSHYLDSKSVVHLLHSIFLEELVLLLRSNHQHVLLHALEALQPLFVVKKKILKKILKRLESSDVGFGLAISNILCRFAANGLREMTICECHTSFSASQDCATRCITSIYQVIFGSKSNVRGKLG